MPDIVCDRKWCRNARFVGYKSAWCPTGLVCGLDAVLISGGKCTGFDKITAEEMAARRAGCPYKDIWN